MLATRKPRTGYKVIRPTLPPAASASPATFSAPIAVGTVGGLLQQHIYQSSPQPLAACTGSLVPPAQPVLAGQQWHHPHAGMIPSPQQVGHNKDSIMSLMELSQWPMAIGMIKHWKIKGTVARKWKLFKLELHNEN